MKKYVPLWLVLIGAVLIVAVVGYMAALKPKRSETAKLKEEAATLAVQLATAQKLVASRGQTPETRIRVADIIEFAKAIPDAQDMAGIVYQLDALAKGAGVKFSAIQPGTPAPGAGYTITPITVTFVGNYYDLTELLYSMRSLVAVRDGVLQAEGRLFTVDAVDFQEPENGGFPLVLGVLTLSAYQQGSVTTGTLPLADTPATGEATTATTDGAPTASTEPPPATTTEPPAAPADGGQEAQGGTP